MAQMSRQLELPFATRGEASSSVRSEQSPTAVSGPERPGAGLLEEALSRPNLFRALRRVEQNQGSPGLDGMSVKDLRPWLREHWPRVRQALLSGGYRPCAVRRVKIPKRGGGERELGIPTVLDRLIQQALLQVLQPRIDGTFSRHSHGFRPGRSAHGAIREARGHIRSGKHWVVDVDIEAFFDRVHHDVLMDRLSKRISDLRVLGLIRRYLSAGVMVHGVVVERYRGTPQGGPLSPLLSNVLLDEIDQKLSRRGHAYVRYADDLRVYVSSERAGARMLRVLVCWLGRLRLRVNASKSAVARAHVRAFLGFGFWVGRGGALHARVSREAWSQMQRRVRELTARNRGRSLQAVVSELAVYLRGWRGYFGLAQTPRRFQDLDRWIRRRLRAYQLKLWRRGSRIFHALTALGAPARSAWRVAVNRRRWWRNAGMLIHVGMRNELFDELGLPRMAP